MKENFHISESEFNRLSNYDRMVYLLDRFYVGQDVCVCVNNESVQFATINGFHPYSDSIERIADGRAQSYSSMSIINNMLVNGKPPCCNITVCITINSPLVADTHYGVSINGNLSSYYPLWIYPDFEKIRNSKIESIIT